MPKFVPVSNPEAPKHEQDFHSLENLKHRKFDNPHAVHKTTTVDRGWQQGSLGWGVLGSFGNSTKDDAAQVIRRTEGAQKMVKDKNGLWKKAKDLSSDEIESEYRQGSRGRGNGIPVFQPQTSSSSSSVTSRFESSKDDSRYRDAEEDEASKYHGHSRGRDRREDSRDRSRKRGESRDRHSRTREDRGSRDDYRAKGTGHERDYRNEEEMDSKRRRGGEYQRDRSRSREKDKKASSSGADHSRSSVFSMSAGKESTPVADEISIEDAAAFDFTAIQIVNHFLELYSSRGSSRLEQIGEMFTPTAIVSSLKTGKILLSGSTSIQASFSKTVPANANPSRRLYIECKVPLIASQDEGTANVSSATETISFCLDLHTPGTSPGLGDPSKDTVLLYRCAQSPVRTSGPAPGIIPTLITDVWGAVDPQKLASQATVTKAILYGSSVWGWAKAVLAKEVPGFDDEFETHFHDYTNIETWGV